MRVMRRIGSAGVIFVLVWGCSSGNKEGPLPSGEGVFESETPGGEAPGVDRAEGSSGQATGGPAATGVDGSANPTAGSPPSAVDDVPTDNDAAVAIEEADIVKVAGDTLYALSQYGGLSVIDIQDPDDLRLLDRHKAMAQPFEMYVREGIVYVLYQGYGEYIYNEDDETYAWVQTSRVVVIDARNPDQLAELDSFEVPGVISDSRIVGDILYVASFEDGYCWGCSQDQPRTAVVSLDISQPDDVKKVDELSFGERPDDVYSWRRSISVNDQRMYVAGPEWGPERPVGSTIQVVDISDRGGALVQGDTVQVAGQINSRWQMDEYEGVLRVVSQPFEWDLTEPPTVETFSVESSAELSALGEVALDLPRPEQLQSARFDGERGYVVTFERTDPLFTVDLHNPAEPVQAGQLEMPGFLYHMEPLGERLIGFGLDQGNESGSLHISLFDVSDLENPLMLDRVNFGGDWGWPVEDQDRIHKALNILPDANLIMMPYSGWIEEEQGGVEGCYSRWLSGVQLIDFEDDSLTLRGTAETLSQARRGLLHQDRLVTIADERVEVFDISDRDAPQSTSEVALARYVQETAGADGTVVRIGQNWYSGTTEVDVTSLEDAADPSSGARVEIPGLELGESCYGGTWLTQAVSAGERTHLIYETYSYDPDTDKASQGTVVATVNTAEPDAPELEGTAELDFTPSYGYYDYNLPFVGRDVALSGSALVFSHGQYDYDDSRGTTRLTDSGVQVVDLSDPNDPKSEFVALPNGLGATGLLSSGNIVVRSRYDQSPTDSSKVRFYIDRVDVSDPSSPEALPAVNVPGSLLAFNADNGRAITVDFRHDTRQGVTYEDCYQENARAVFTPPNDDWSNVDAGTEGTCQAVVQTLALIEINDDEAELVDSLELDRSEAVGQVAGDQTLFVMLGGGYGYYDAPVAVGGVAVAGPVGDCFDCFGFYSYFNNGTSTVLTLSGLDGGDFDDGRVELDNGDSYSTALVAVGEKAVVSSGWRGKLSLLDASDVTEPRVAEEREITGYVNSLTLVDDVAVASMGYDGVETIALR